MDKEQFTQQVLAAEQTLYRVAKSMLMNEADCEDAVQDAVIAAYTHLERLQNPAYFKTWLIRILINGCKKRLRQAKRTCALEEWMPLEQNTVLSDLEVQTQNSADSCSVLCGRILCPGDWNHVEDSDRNGQKPPVKSQKGVENGIGSEECI